MNQKEEQLHSNSPKYYKNNHTVKFFTSDISANLKLLAPKIFFTALLLNFKAADKTRKINLLSTFNSKALAPLSKLVFRTIADSSLVLVGACYFIILYFKETILDFRFI